MRAHHLFSYALLLSIATLLTPACAKRHFNGGLNLRLDGRVVDVQRKPVANADVQLAAKVDDNPAEIIFRSRTDSEGGVVGDVPFSYQYDSRVWIWSGPPTKSALTLNLTVRREGFAEEQIPLEVGDSRQAFGTEPIAFEVILNKK